MHLLLAVRELLDRGLAALASLGSVWVCSWAIRRAGEFDYPLDFTAKLVRWALVIVLLGSAEYFPGLSTYRLALGSAGIAFLAWPNFAYHLTRLLRWCRLLPKAPPLPDPSSLQKGYDGPKPLRSQGPAIFGFTQERNKNEREQTDTVKWR